MADNGSLTEAEIDAMKPGKVYKTLTKYDVDGDDLSIDEAKIALKKKIRELKQKEEAEKASLEQETADTTKLYRAKREILLQRCKEIRDYLPTLEQSNREKLSLQFGRDVVDILDEAQEHLSKDDCPILVAGETSSGKSNFINLLLGENILPVAHLSSTSIICEVKYGEKRCAVVHLREDDPKTGSKQIHLKLGTELKECREQLDPYVHLKEREREILPPATKIEIFWPLTLLKGGVTIVDSPGVGENDMMDDFIAKYIPSAFAFIYVIDSSRAGGVQQDRLGRLLLKCKDKGARSELDGFDPTKAIFVCNKWDTVSEEERGTVMKDTIGKLREMWHGLDESRVFTHSNKVGFQSADCNKLLNAIYELMPQSLNHKLSIQYRRMVNILKEALTFINLTLNSAHRNIEQREAKMALSHFNESTAGIIEEKQNFLEGAVESAVTILLEILHEDELELKERLYEHVPIKANTSEEDALQALMSQTEDYLTSRQQFRDHVDATSQTFFKEYQEMVTTVSQNYDQKVRPVTGVPFHRLTAAAVVSSSAFWIGLVTFLSGLWIPSISFAAIYFGFGVWHVASEERRLRLCDKAIITMKRDEILYSLAKRTLCRCFEGWSDFKSDLDAKKKLDERLLEERFAETRTEQDLISTYKPQARRITLMLGRLAMVELKEMRKFEFDWEGIMGSQDPQNRIAVGSYGAVYRVMVQRKGSAVQAALKVGVMPYDITTEENAWEFLTEEDNLRKLKGDHIVEYYGTVCKKEEGGLKMGLVMELCEGTLGSRIIGKIEHNPARWGQDAEKKQRAFSYIQDKAIQLCEGLKTIHDAGYIHRDLKLINILVAAGDVVKLADVGLTKREVNVTGTIAGTPIYAAPEVKERKVYDKSADIYSLGLMLWEMWYGQIVDDRNLRGLTEGDSRMILQFPDSIPPIQQWASLVRDCIHTDPSSRPTVLQCLEKIRVMTTEVTSKHAMAVSTV